MFWLGRPVGRPSSFWRGLQGVFAADYPCGVIFSLAEGVFRAGPVAGVELVEGFRTTFIRSEPKFLDPNQKSLPSPLVGTPPALRSAPSGHVRTEGIAQAEDMAR